MPHANMKMGDDGILRVSFIGDTGKQGAEAFINALEPFLQAAPETEPLCAILDATQSGKLSARARKIFFGLNRDPRVGKVAVLGSRRYLRVLGQFILKATQRDNIRFFNLEQEAVAWLQAPLSGGKTRR